MTFVGSPNYDPGRGGQSVSLIVVHHMVGTLRSTDAVFQNQQRNTSAHYGVGRGGEIHQYVREGDTAFHAGEFLINQRSIGIEHEDLGVDDFTELEYQTSAALIRDICLRYNLPISRATIHPHKEYFATACPGALDIDKLINLANKGDNMNLTAAQEAQLYRDYLGREPEPGAQLGNRTELQFYQDAKGEIVNTRKALQDEIAKLKAQPGNISAASTDQLLKEVLRRVQS